jgi:hypothetical protein
VRYYEEKLKILQSIKQQTEDGSTKISKGKRKKINLEPGDKRKVKSKGHTKKNETPNMRCYLRMVTAGS